MNGVNCDSHVVISDSLRGVLLVSSLSAVVKGERCPTYILDKPSKFDAFALIVCQTFNIKVSQLS